MSSSRQYTAVRERRTQLNERTDKRRNSPQSSTLPVSARRREREAAQLVGGRSKALRRIAKQSVSSSKTARSFDNTRRMEGVSDVQMFIHSFTFTTHTSTSCSDILNTIFLKEDVSSARFNTVKANRGPVICLTSLAKTATGLYFYAAGV